ncbi:MAG TPA: cytochrome c3 family protein [Anaerolineae bacterium]|nr:cytochrome c3 family protein [Anaerolineae bacterium]
MKSWLRWVGLGMLAGLFLFGWAAINVQAAPVTQTPTPQAITSDQQCNDCHTKADQYKPLLSGESLYLTVDQTAFDISLHGQNEVSCSSCHSNITTYPHPPLVQQSLRQIAASFSQSCKECHADEAARQLDSIHQQARAQGNENAAVCSDCHNPHYTTQPAEPRSKIAVTTCNKCHSGIAQEYRQSVHGAALVGDENPDVPVCIDCHGVHNISDPRTNQFLLNSPQICAKCHSDPQRMSKYGIRTDVVNTYVADFHGTTVTLFEQKSPDQLPNKPLCIDCHGIHDIKSIKDPDSPVVKANLLATCQKCHPSATDNFPGAWLSHYPPSPDHNPLVYYVGVFYQIFIPLVLGGLLLFVVTDMGHRLVRRIKGGPRK